MLQIEFLWFSFDCLMLLNGVILFEMSFVLMLIMLYLSCLVMCQMWLMLWLKKYEVRLNFVLLVRCMIFVLFWNLKMVEMGLKVFLCVISMLGVVLVSIVGLMKCCELKFCISLLLVVRCVFFCVVLLMWCCIFFMVWLLISGFCIMLDLKLLLILMLCILVESFLINVLYIEVCMQKWFVYMQVWFVLWYFDCIVFFMVVLMLVLLNMINGVWLFSLSVIFFIVGEYCCIRMWFIGVELVNDRCCMIGDLYRVLLMVIE